MFKFLGFNSQEIHFKRGRIISNNDLIDTWL